MAVFGCITHFTLKLFPDKLQFPRLEGSKIENNIQWNIGKKYWFIFSKWTLFMCIKYPNQYFNCKIEPIWSFLVNFSYFCADLLFSDQCAGPQDGRRRQKPWSYGSHPQFWKCLPDLWKKLSRLYRDIFLIFVIKNFVNKGPFI